MFTQINSAGIHGMEGFLVSVESDVSNGLPGFSISGQLALEVREAQERVRTALKNSDLQLPAKKITVNLSPAGMKKEGTAFDLPIAAAVLGAFELLAAEKLKDSLLIGELGLDGSVKPVRGVLVLVSAAKKMGFRRCFLPVPNMAEGALVEGIQIIGIKSLLHLQEVVSQENFESMDQKMPVTINNRTFKSEYPFDFREICGQNVLRRAAEVAAAGRHGLLMCGSAGTGKSMVAKRIPTILPDLSWEENIEISKIYSLCGLLPEGQPLLSQRPFRSPHHTISPQGLTGGGKVPKPGELSLASGGVLFLDELPHFSKGAIEALREPLEEHRITISRVAGSYEFPADFYRSVQLPEIFLKDFQVNAPFQEGYATVRVIEINPDRTHTTEKLVEMPVKAGKICWENSGCLLAMVVERHGKNGNIGYGFLTGSCLKKGTVATTYFHDHHNLFVAGSSPDDMLFAVNRIRELQGGFLTVKDGRILSELALPVCGLLSEKSIRENGLALKAVRKSLTDLGYVHNNPIMSVATLGLPVSPALKLTDKGLVDVKKGEIVPLIVNTKKNK